MCENCGIKITPILAFFWFFIKPFYKFYTDHFTEIRSFNFEYVDIRVSNREELDKHGFKTFKIQISKFANPIKEAFKVFNTKRLGDFIVIYKLYDTKAGSLVWDCYNGLLDTSRYGRDRTLKWANVKGHKCTINVVTVKVEDNVNINPVIEV